MELNSSQKQSPDRDAPSATRDPRVSAAWLASRIREPGLFVLDATLAPPGLQAGGQAEPRARYLAGHLPGAVFFDIEALSDHASPLPHMLPSPESFGRAMAALGVDRDHTLVVYEQAGVFSAPRAWWMLRSFGAREVLLLDGGLRAWTEAGFALEAGQATRAPARFAAAPAGAAVSSYAQLQQALANGGQVLDARASGRFSGASPEPRPGLPSGHMPGAINLPFSELVEAGRLKPAAALQKIFAEKGVDLARPVTTTCGSGVTAAVLTLGLTIAGAKQLQLYDGSWTEYAQQPNAAIETVQGTEP